MLGGFERVGDIAQGFRRKAASNNPAGNRWLVYRVGKSKPGIEGLGRVLTLGPGLLVGIWWVGIE